MPYYIKTTLTGEDGATAPDVPENSGWGGLQYEDGTSLVLVYPPISGAEPLDRDGLAAECAARGLELEAALAWRVGTHGGEEVL